MKLKTEDYYMYRGTSSIEFNSIEDTSDSGETISWKIVGGHVLRIFNFNFPNNCTHTICR